MPLQDAEFHCTLGDDAFLFRRLQAVEELGRLPEYRLELLRRSDLDPVDADDLLGTQATVELLLEDGSKRHLNGWVTRVEHGGATGRLDNYHLELKPWLWYLTLGADCRIFQNQTVVQILQAVFADYGNQSVQNKLSGTYESRAFCVQYRETDFDFVSRLMEEEGIYYYFKHSDGQHVLVLCDDTSAHPALPGLPDGALAWAGAQDDDHLRDDLVLRWRRAQTVRSLKYAHTDFDFEIPTADLATDKSRTTKHPNPGDLEVRDYPGGYQDLSLAAQGGPQKTVGARRAQARVDAFASGQVTASATTRFRGAAAGFTFTLKDHPTDAGDYLITRAAYEAEFGEYEASERETSAGFSCRLVVVPKSVRFQPQPVTPRPSVRGPQTAVVVGAGGDELTTDKYGRVKLQFRWDRLGKSDAASSCWVRVSHPWASKQFGMIALPRVGDEVVVEFLEGDPDRPLVTGRVYNADNLPPYALPDHATVSGIRTRSSKDGSSDNFNELRFEDKLGSEYVWLQAEKDFHRWVKNDAFDTVKNDAWTVVEQNASTRIGQTLTLAVGATSTVKLDGDVHAALGADLNMGVAGRFNLKVADDVAIKGDGAVALSVAKGLDIDSTDAVKLTAGSTLHVKGLGVVIDGQTELTIKAGGAFITLGPEGVCISGTLVKVNSGGSAGSAGSAASASPAEPKPPEEPKENQDPLAS